MVKLYQQLGVPFGEYLDSEKADNSNECKACIKEIVIEHSLLPGPCKLVHGQGSTNPVVKLAVQMENMEKCDIRFKNCKYKENHEEQNNRSSCSHNVPLWF